jgi:radical SAM protein with 4Fe4S-binding SPASM domain
MSGDQETFFARREPCGDFCYVASVGGYREIEEVAPSAQVRVLDRRDGQRELSAPIQVVAYPSLSCNLNCPFCYLPTRSAARMSDNTIDSLLGYMQDRYVGRLQILGGEPFLPGTREVTRRIIERANAFSAVQELTLTTNGLYLDEVDTDWLWAQGVAVSISVHGIGEQYNAAVGAGIRDASSKLWANLKALERQRKAIDLTTVVTTANITHLPVLRNAIDTLSNVRSWALLYPIVNERTRPLAPNLLDFFQAAEALADQTHYLFNISMPFQYRLRGSPPPQSRFEQMLCRCSTIDSNKIEVLPDGTVYHCCMLLDAPDLALGNINDTDFTTRRQYPTNAKIIPCRPVDCRYYAHCYGCLGWARKNGRREDNRCPFAHAHCTT